MKKIVLTTVFICLGLILIAQNNNQTDEITDLQKQVTTLSYTNYKVKKNLESFIKTSRYVQDSIISRLNGNEIILKTQSISLTSAESKITSLEAATEKNESKIKIYALTNSCFLLLILILLVVLYILQSKKIKTEQKKNEASMLKIKESFEAELSKLKKEIKEIQEELEDKKSKAKK